MNTIRILLILLISQTQNGYGQRNKSDSLINKFRNDIKIEQEEHSGVVVMDDETTESYYLVLSNCSIKDLVKYTNDTNAVVRSYIFAGLLRRKVNKNVLLKILDIHKNDTAEFRSRSTDVETKWTVKEFMQSGLKFNSANKLSVIDYKKRIEKIRGQTKIEISAMHHGLIEKEELLKIDSLVITGNKLRIISFTLFAEEKTIKSSSNILTNDMKIAIKETEPRSILIFTDIKIVGQDSIVWHGPSMVVKLK